MRLSWAYAIRYAPAGLLKMIDASALAVWVAAEVTHRTAALEVMRLGPMVLTSKRKGAQATQNPYLAVMNKQALVMMRAVVELGFSPRARASVTTGGLPQDNPFNEFD